MSLQCKLAASSSHSDFEACVNLLQTDSHLHSCRVKFAKTKRGGCGLLVRCRLREKRVPGSEPDSTEDPSHIGPIKRQIICRESNALRWCGAEARRGGDMPGHSRAAKLVKITKNFDDIKATDARARRLRRFIHRWREILLKNC
ncbi:hypothetical protein AVEN_220125-1 [Araneus ventricosus]|uniref:Uncharacterized protein n=1 Tax=Araneus ventricosus TaxID=182803 RepID=A0A4Y2C417_ARAVE|nr:hypothetical protein AVEN_220125-1 [Araneus ventricosus]